MSARIHAEIEKIRTTLDQLDRIERRIVRMTGRLEGEPGEAAARVAIAQISGSREALAQAEEELEVHDGLYLDA